jgi:amidase
MIFKIKSWAIAGKMWLGLVSGVLLCSVVALAASGVGASIVPETEDIGDMIRARMAAHEPSLNAVIALSPSLDEQVDAAGEKDLAERPLHGLPVFLKDNIESIEQATTAGSLALADNHTRRDAELTRRLREAGLVIAGKTNLSEWANFRDDDSTSGWSGVGGLTRNAIDPSRSACGSSSGSAVAVAAGYVPFAIGTETNGSIVCPSSSNGIVGIKPTVGLVSRTGIVPIAHSQDTAGPMAYSVKAAALLLSAMEGPDPADPATLAARDHFGRDYVSGLSDTGLQGMRVGVIRSFKFKAGAMDLFDQAVVDVGQAGAILVDELEFPEWPEGFWDDSSAVLEFEFKHDLNSYLAGLPGAAGDLTLEKLIAYNQQHADREMPWFGQSLFESSQARGNLESEEYLLALQRVQGFTRSAIDDLLAKHALDLLLMPTSGLTFSIDLVHGDNYPGGSSSMAAIAGYPNITVPAGRIKGLPMGLSFVGTAFSEPLLIRAAYAYEQATQHATTLEGKDPWKLERRWASQDELEPGSH